VLESGKDLLRFAVGQGPHWTHGWLSYRTFHIMSLWPPTATAHRVLMGAVMVEWIIIRLDWDDPRVATFLGIWFFCMEACGSVHRFCIDGLFWLRRSFHHQRKFYTSGSNLIYNNCL
jgi:hypothetical protein